MPKAARKMALLHHVKWMQQAKLLAHHTSTLAGVAAMPCALQQLHCFKQRQGPFLLLVANTKTALHMARYISPVLRQQIKQGWPHQTTLIFPARPHLDARLYQKSTLAIRVDSNPDCQFLAKKLGGFFISSSLNRRGQISKTPAFYLNWRWQRFAMRCDPSKVTQTITQPSSLLRIKSTHIEHLR